MNLVCRLFFIATSIWFSSSILADTKGSVEIDIPSRYCSDHFSMIVFSFQNNSNDWQTYSNIKLDFGSEVLNESVELVLGERLEAWYEAHDLKEARNKVIKGLVMGSLGVFSVIPGDTDSGSFQAMQELSSKAFLVGGTALSIDKLSQSLKYKVFPEGHLLQKDIVVPAGFKVKRWVLINTTNDSDESKLIKKLDFSASLNDESVSQVFSIRSEAGQPKFGCRWQKSLAPPVPTSRDRR